MLILIFGVLLSYLTFSNVDVVKVDAHSKTLLAVSASVFTLAGIWVAYIYPQAIAVFTNPEKISLLKGGELTEGVEKLVLVMMSSGVTIAFILVSDFIIFVYSNLVLSYPEIVMTYDYGMSILICFMVYFSIIQFLAILSVLVRNFHFVDVLYRFRNSNNAHEDL